MEIAAVLAKEFNQKPEHVNNIISLVDGGSTIPFIARYRKEMTGSCDDQVLRELCDRLTYLRNLESRKKEVSESIQTQGNLTDELKLSLDAAATLAEVEDIYRPYKPKRRTRASIAQEKGLAPLADAICKQEASASPESLAEAFIDAQKGVETVQQAIDGAKDILAERMSDDAVTRKFLRALMRRDGTLTVRALKQEDSVYRMYYDYSEPIAHIPSHRVLAINRGEREEFLKVGVVMNEEAAVAILDKKFVKPNGGACAKRVREAAEDAWERLLRPSIERETRSELTDMASEQAISMFALNLKPLLLQPPVRGKRALGLDPAYRTGCKIAVVDETGKALETAVVYPTPPQSKKEEAAKTLAHLIEKHDVSIIAIGNGTASRESEMFVADLIKGLKRDLSYMVVNEAGASVYSASKLAAKEFPDYDVSLRSAVSIARRLQDPLAELVKIDPKSIGVGQYQHDLPPARLDSSLSGVVEDCVNSVGVDVNTASVSLLSHISGLNATAAQNVVAFRDEKRQLQIPLRTQKSTAAWTQGVRAVRRVFAHYRR